MPKRYRQPTTTRAIKKWIDDLEDEEIQMTEFSMLNVQAQLPGSVYAEKLRLFTKDWFYAFKKGKIDTTTTNVFRGGFDFLDEDQKNLTEMEYGHHVMGVIAHQFKKRYNKRYSNQFKAFFSGPLFQDNQFEVPEGFMFAGFKNNERVVSREGEIIDFSKVTSIRKLGGNTSEWRSVKKEMEEELVNKPNPILMSTRNGRSVYVPKKVKFRKVLLRRAIDFAISKQNRQTNIVFLLQGGETTNKYGTKKYRINHKIYPKKGIYAELKNTVWLSSGFQTKEVYGSDTNAYKKYHINQIMHVIAFNEKAMEKSTFRKQRKAGAFFPWLFKKEHKDTLAPLFKRYGLYAQVDPANYTGGNCLYKCFERSKSKSLKGGYEPTFTDKELTEIHAYCSNNLVNRMVPTAKLKEMALKFGYFVKLAQRFDNKIINGKMSFQWRDECVIHHRHVSKIHCKKCKSRPTYGSDPNKPPTHCEICQEEGMKLIVDVCRCCKKQFDDIWLRDNPTKKEVPTDLPLKQYSKFKPGCTKPKYAHEGSTFGLRCYNCKLPTDMEMYKCPCFYENLKGKRKAIFICNHERHYFLKERLPLTIHALHNSTEMSVKLEGKEWNKYMKNGKKGNTANFKSTHHLIAEMLDHKAKFFQKDPIDTNAAILKTNRAAKYDHPCPTQPLRVPEGLFEHKEGELNEIKDCFVTSKEEYFKLLKEKAKVNTKNWQKPKKEIRYSDLWLSLITIKDEKKKQLDIKLSNGRPIIIAKAKNWDIDEITGEMFKRFISISFDGKVFLMNIFTDVISINPKHLGVLYDQHKNKIGQKGVKEMLEQAMFKMVEITKQRFDRYIDNKWSKNVDIMSFEKKVKDIDFKDLQKMAFVVTHHQINKLKRTDPIRIFKQIVFASDTETYTEKGPDKTQKVFMVGYNHVNYTSINKLYTKTYEEAKYVLEYSLLGMIFKSQFKKLREQGYQEFFSKDGDETDFLTDFMNSLVDSVKIDVDNYGVVEQYNGIKEEFEQILKEVKCKKEKAKIKKNRDESLESMITNHLEAYMGGRGMYYKVTTRLAKDRKVMEILTKKKKKNIIKMFEQAVTKFYKASSNLTIKVMFHNARFDVTSLFYSSDQLRKDFELNGVTEPAGSLLTYRGRYKGANISFNCSTRLFGPVGLKKLPEAYGFEDKIQKGDMFYSLLKNHKDMYKPMSKKTIFDIVVGKNHGKFHLQNTDLVIHEFNKDVNEQGHYTAYRKIDWKKWYDFLENAKPYTDSDGNIDMLKYCLRYMEIDVQVLKVALEANHVQNREITEGLIDARTQLTCSGIGDKYLVAKYYGNECYTIRNVVADFIKEQCVVGGRCQNRENKSVITGFKKPELSTPKDEVEEMRQEAIKNICYLNGKMFKVDASSLYPFAESLCGVLKGVPKLIQPGTTIQELFSKSQFFSKCKLTLKPKPQQGPEKGFSEHSYIEQETGSRVWTNTFEAVDHTVILNREAFYAMKKWNRFYDMDKTQVLGGYYFDAGFDRSICKKIKDLFKQRIKLKEYCVKCGKHVSEHTKDGECKFKKNPLEQLVKLLLNSSLFGKCIQKFYEVDTIIRSKNKYLLDFETEEQAKLCIKQLEESCLTCKNPIYFMKLVEEGEVLVLKHTGKDNQKQLLKMFENFTIKEAIQGKLQSLYVFEELFDLERTEYLYKLQEEWLINNDLISKPFPEKRYNSQKFKQKPPAWLISRERNGSGENSKPKWKVYREQMQTILSLKKKSQKVVYKQKEVGFSSLRPCFTTLAGEDMIQNNTYEPMYKRQIDYNQISAQPMKRELRSNIYAKHHIDVDISNAYPSVLHIIMMKKEIAFLEKYKTLTEYCTDRAGFFKKVFKAGYVNDRASLKKTCLRYLFQSETTILERHVVEPLLQLQKECNLIKEELFELKWSQMSSSKHKGAALSVYLQHETALILNQAITHLKSKGHTIAACIFDGLLVRNDKTIDFDDLNTAIQKHLKTEKQIIKFLPKKFEDVVDIDRTVIETQDYKDVPISMKTENPDAKKYHEMKYNQVEKRFELMKASNKKFSNFVMQYLPNKACVYFRNKLELVKEEPQCQKNGENISVERLKELVEKYENHLEYYKDIMTRRKLKKSEERLYKQNRDQLKYYKGTQKYVLTTDDSERFLSYNSHKIHSVHDEETYDHKTYHRKIKVYNNREEYWTRAHVGSSILSYSKFGMSLFMNQCKDSFGSGDTDSFSCLEKDIMQGAQSYRTDPFTIDWKLGCFYRHDTPKNEWRKRFVVDDEFFSKETIRDRQRMTPAQLQKVINNPETYEQLTTALGNRLGEFNSDLELKIEGKNKDAYFTKSVDKCKKNYTKICYADDSKGKRHYKYKIACKGVPLASMWYALTSSSKCEAKWEHKNEHCWCGPDCKKRNCKALDKIWSKRVTDTTPINSFRKDVEYPIRVALEPKNKNESERQKKKRARVDQLIKKYNLPNEDYISVTCPLKTEFRYKNGRCCHGIMSEKINQSTTRAAKRARSEFEKHKERLFEKYKERLLKKYVKDNAMISKNELEQKQINQSVQH